MKVLHGHLAESANFVTRFKREARSLGQLQHPNIVRVIDFDVSGEMYFMVMDYIAGKTLRDYLDEKGVLSSSEALFLAGQLTDALAYAHQNGMIHRDIKPANVMFADIECTQAVLTDFGITRLMDDESITMTGALVGTPAYMSPEAVMGEKVDGRSDIYSLGVILYEMVTGRAPYQGNTPLSLVVKQVHEPLPSPLNYNPDLPLPIVYILEKALAKSADDRYQTANELLADIQDTQQSLGDTPHGATIAGTKQVAETATSTALSAGVFPDPPTTVKPKQTTAATNRTRWTVAGVLAAIILFAGIFLLSRNNNAAEETAVSITTTIAPTTKPTSQPTTEPTAADVPAVITDPTKPAPESAAEPTAEPAITPAETAVSIPFDIPNRFGGLRFTDNDTAPLGTLTLQLNRVPQPPADFHYELWLESAEGVVQNAGPVEVENGRVFTTVSRSENLLRTTNRVFISVEPDGTAPSQISGDIAFTGELPAGFLSEIRQVLVDGGDGVGLLDNALEQTAVAAQHAGFALDALSANNLTEAKQHLEHVVNILDGESGDRFGDVNLDGQSQNPGDGVGVRVYLEKSRDHLQQALQTESITIVQQRQGAEAIAAIDNSLLTLENTLNNALTMLSTDTPAEAQPFADALQAGLNELQRTDNRPTIVAAFEQTQILAEIPLIATSDKLAQPDPVANADSGQVGLVQFGKSGGVENGRISLQLDQIPAPTTDQQLVAWLQNSTSNELLPLGPVEIRSEWGNLTVAGDRNLLDDFDRLLISSEPAAQTNSITGDILYAADLQAELAQQLQQLLFDSSTGKGALFGVEEQIGIALQHYQFSVDALNSGNFTEVKQHTEHIINILDGEGGDFFGDLNQDGQTQNPGDGVGVRGYWRQVVEDVGVMGETAVFTPNQQFYATLLTTTAENNILATLETIDQASKILASDTAEEAQPFIDNVGLLLNSLLTGTDLDNNGVIDPLLGEAGVEASTNLALDINEIPITLVRSE